MSHGSGITFSYAKIRHNNAIKSLKESKIVINELSGKIKNMRGKSITDRDVMKLIEDIMYFQAIYAKLSSDAIVWEQIMWLLCPICVVDQESECKVCGYKGGTNSGNNEE